MKNRTNKRRLYARIKPAVSPPRQFLKDTLRGAVKVMAGKVKPYFGAGKSRPKVRPVKLDLSGAEGTRIVLDAARHVIEKHAAVIKALANR